METEQYYKEIKNILINNEVYKRVKDYSKNRSDLLSYYNVGKLIVEAQGGEKKAQYGNQLIKRFSLKLTSELGKGYSVQSLKDMRRFYLFQKRHALHVLLSWNHYKELMRIDNINQITYYVDISLNQNLSYRQLHKKIKSKEYERLPDATKNKLIKKEETSISDYIKDPIYIQSNKEIYSEKILQSIIVENIQNFMQQLGPGYAFIDKEYKIKIGNNNNYIDLLLFNYIYNAFVVIELKITALRKEHIGQIEIYMNYIDKHLKTNEENKTMGIIIYKEGNKYLLHYSTEKNIYAAKYITIVL